jgi:hypothetical protein
LFRFRPSNRLENVFTQPRSVAVARDWQLSTHSGRSLTTKLTGEYEAQRKIRPVQRLVILV